jgi:hypothetical protein
MNNFIFGVDAVLSSLSGVLKVFIANPWFWGFSIGLLISTLVHGFILSANPKQVPIILFNSKADSFQKIHAPQKNGSYQVSYSEFAKIAEEVKLVFSLSLFLFLSIVLAALVIF